MTAKTAPGTPLDLAQQLISVLPPIMQQLRAQARVAIKGKLTLPQFRILANIRTGINTVGGIADNIGVTQPTMSKMVDGLVLKGLIKRETHISDRRQINLTLTKKGDTLFLQSRQLVQMSLSQKFKSIPIEHRSELTAALNLIQTVLLPAVRGEINHLEPRARAS